MTRTHKYSVNTNNSSAAHQQDVESGTAPTSTSSAKSHGNTSKADLEGVNTEPNNGCCSACSFNWGWFCTILVGMASLAFILCIYLIPSEGLFPVGVDLKNGMIPLVRKGNLVVYPGQLSPDAIRRGTTDSYIISMDPSNFGNMENTLNNITSDYPHNISSEGLPPKPYVFCFLQNPNPNSPCYFRRIWLGNTCTPLTNYGYRVDHGNFNPCFLIRLADTADWYPENWQPHQVRESYKSTEYDSSHIGITCSSQNYVDQYKVNFTKSPMNGFAQKFFPVSNFRNDYIPPAVMFQINGLKIKETFTINCQLRARNAYQLRDSGSIAITFQGHNDQPDARSDMKRGAISNTENTKTSFDKNVTIPSDSTTTFRLQPKNPV